MSRLFSVSGILAHAPIVPSNELRNEHDHMEMHCGQRRPTPRTKHQKSVGDNPARL